MNGTHLLVTIVTRHSPFACQSCLGNWVLKGLTGVQKEGRSAPVHLGALGEGGLDEEGDRNMQMLPGPLRSRLGPLGEGCLRPNYRNGFKQLLAELHANYIIKYVAA